MEHYFHSVRYGVEKMAATNGIQHWIVPVVDDVVRRNGGETVALEREYTAFQTDHVAFQEEFVRFW